MNQDMTKNGEHCIFKTMLSFSPTEDRSNLKIHVWKMYSPNADRSLPKFYMFWEMFHPERRVKQHFLASRDDCQGSLCHSPSVGVGVSIRIGIRVGCVDRNFNLGHNFQTERDRAFIFHMCVPYDLVALTLKFDLL